MLKILDAHCHIFPDKIAQKASKAIGDFYGLPSKMDGTVATLLSEGKKAGISHFLVQSVATTPKQVPSINNFISETVKKSGGIMTGFGSLHPEREDIEADVRSIIDLGLLGVKLHPDIQGFKLDDFRMLKIYELCEKNHLPILMHCGDNRYDNSNPNRLKPILDIYTDLVVIGAHLGGYSVWDDAAEKLSGYKNFYVDTSSTLFKIGTKKARKLIDIFGVDKVLFGTDYPMWNFDEEVKKFFEIDLTESEQKKILWENAAGLLRI